MVTEAVRRSWLTLRLRLVLLATVAVVLILVVGGLGLLAGLQRALTASVEDTARARAETVILLARSDDIPDAIPVADEEHTLVQIVDADGRVLAASENIEGQSAIRAEMVPVGSSVAYTIAATPIDDDAAARFVSTGVDGPDGPVTVTVGESLEEVSDAVAAAGRLGALGLPVLTLGVAVVVWLLVGRALRPVEAIRREAEEIGGGELHRRVPSPSRQDEIGRLATTMNAMLGRLEDSARRHQQFVGDAAHELRSPVASLRTQLETARASTRDVDWPELSQDLLDETLRMQEVTEQLLILARVDATSAAIVRQTVDLDDLADRQVRHASERRTDVSVRSTASPVQVVGDPILLGQMVRNLVDNAVRHASSSVVVTSRQREGAALLTVTDDGAGIPPGDRERVFERFVRLDEARSREGGGTGLGLAIVRDIAHLHGGTVRIVERRPGTTFEVRLPLDPDDP